MNHNARSFTAVPGNSDRYIRQQIFPAIGRDGQRKIGATHVALVGCGALGSTVADLLVRSGVGQLTIADRDYVELHNLQRQSLFDESDVSEHIPKAAAAARRLTEINREVEINPVIADVNGGNIEQIVRDADFLVDGTDNFETRYLINDVAVKHGKPWVYGGVIASYGMTMTIVPGETSCLRCVFPEQPEAGSAPTCDTAGVIAPAVHAVASFQVAEILKLIVGDHENLNRDLIALDLWAHTFDRVTTGSPRSDCPTCGSRQFEFLDRAAASHETVLCGHDAVQVLVQPPVKLDLHALGERLSAAGDVMPNRFLLKFTDRATERELTIFPDGRAIVKGTTDPVEARALYARFVGN
jgi:molybdopterin/thiamine biosynthesis adenylyltransferase